MTPDDHPQTDPDPDSPRPLYARFPRRLLAVAMDGFILVLAFYLGIMAADATGSATVIRLAFSALLLLLVLYEPLLVSYTGSTLGHRLENLRVVREHDGGNLSFRAAMLRWLLKSIIGAPSFIFMALTRRHQALHDLAVGSTVRIRRPERADPIHVSEERPYDGSPAQAVPAWRRILFILGYVVPLYLFSTIAAVLFVSETCALGGTCTASDEETFTLFGLAWLALGAVVLVQGWRGRLPGARPPRVRPAVDSG